MATPPAMQCRVCRRQAAEYTCPRCNARYCSVDCYQQHSERCTEGFYRDAAVSELKSISASEGEKQHMLEILQRMHQQEVEGSGDEEGSGDGAGGSGEEDEEEDGVLSEKTLHRLLAKMQASGETLEVGPEDLSPQELAAFHRSLAAGELSGAVEAWRPWWLTEDAARLELSAGGTALVTAEAAGEEAEGASAGARAQGGNILQQQQQQQTQLQRQQQAQGSGQEAAGQAALSSTLPVPPSRPLPPLAVLTKAAPSPLLQYQLLDLLYAYCLTLRRYNGDYQWEAADAADTLFALSSVLAAVVPPSQLGSSSTSASSETSTAEAAAPALLGCVQRACQPPVGSRESRTFAVSVLSDVAAMLQLGRPVVLTALMDASRLVEAARQQVEAAGNAGGGEGGSTRDKQQQKQLRRRLVAAERKLLFFLSWANEQPLEAYELLAMTTTAEHQKHAAALGAGSQPAAAAGGLQSLLVGRPSTGSGPGMPGAGRAAEAEAGGDGRAPLSRVLIEELV